MSTPKKGYDSKETKATQKSESEIEIPDEYLCPISRQIMLDPVSTTDGETYEREAIEAWLKTHNTCPRTNQRLANKNLTPNKSLKRLIGQFLGNNPSLWEGDQVYTSKTLIESLAKAVAANNHDEVNLIISKDKRLLKIPLKQEKTLLSLALEQKSLPIVKLVINKLGKDIQNLPEARYFSESNENNELQKIITSVFEKLIQDSKNDNVLSNALLELREEKVQKELKDFFVEQIQEFKFFDEIDKEAKKAATAEEKEAGAITIMKMFSRATEGIAKNISQSNRISKSLRDALVESLVAFYSLLSIGIDENILIDRGRKLGIEIANTIKSIKEEGEDKAEFQRKCLDYLKTVYLDCVSKELNKLRNSSVEEFKQLVIEEKASSIPAQRLFHKAVYELGLEGAKIIGSALEWEVKQYQQQFWLGVNWSIPQLVAVCLDLKADPSEANTQGLRPAHIAVDNEQKEILVLLAKHGQIDAQNSAGNSALHCAILNNNINQVSLLIASGADVNKRNRNGLYPLEASIQQIKSGQGSLKIVELLLEAKADPNIVNAQNEPLFIWVLKSGMSDVLRLLTKFHVDVNKAGTDGEPPLHQTFLFTGKEMEAVLKIILTSGSDINVDAKDAKGFTPLQKAVSNQNLGAVKLLADYKANLQVADPQGNTVLHQAAKYNFEGLTKLLLQARANPNIRNKDKQSPAKVAALSNYENLSALLRQASFERKMEPIIAPLKQEVEKLRSQVNALEKKQSLMLIEAKISPSIFNLKEAALQGDADAQARLGYAYLNSDCGVTKDVAEATKWLKLATQQANTPAGQYSQGMCYETGLDVKKDKKEAVRLYSLAAAQNYAPAQCNLGLCFDNGTGVTKDEKEAVRLYHLAAAQNYAPAQCTLGLCFDNGTGVTKDEKEAVRLYHLAAAQNYALAQYNLGRCFEDGTGVTKDEKEAVRLYSLAAAQNDAPAQYSLGCCFENGTGVSKNLGEAIRLYTLAASQGNQDAQTALDRIQPRSIGLYPGRQ